jgi:hypothetical protein
LKRFCNFLVLAETTIAAVRLWLRRGITRRESRMRSSSSAACLTFKSTSNPLRLKLLRTTATSRATTLASTSLVTTNNACKSVRTTLSAPTAHVGLHTRTSASMRAIVVSKQGDPSVLELKQDLPHPAPAPGQVRSLAPVAIFCCVCACAHECACTCGCRCWWR